MSVQETKSIIGALRLRLQPLNVKELAWIFRVTEDTALKWIQECRVPAFRIGKTVRIDPQLLADMLQRDVSVWEAKQELNDRRLKLIEKEGKIREKNLRTRLKLQEEGERRIEERTARTNALYSALSSQLGLSCLAREGEAQNGEPQGGSEEGG